MDLQQKKMEFFRKLVDESSLSNESKSAHGQFRKFLHANDRDYDSTPGSPDVNQTEYLGRLDTFSANLQMIDARNAHEQETNTNPNRAVHGITKYADWTPAEFKALLGKKSREERAEKGYPSARILSTPDAPNSGTSLLETSAQCTWNWASRLPEVRNQGKCGNCWTFGTAKTLRAAYIQQHGEDPGELSTQFLTDCMEKTTCSDGVNGCCGGDANAAMEWIRKQGGIPTAEDYGDRLTQASMLETSMNSSRSNGGPVSPAAHGITYSGNYPTRDFPCKTGITKSVTLTKAPVQMTTEADMAAYVCNTGVLAIAVDANAWQTYVKGVMQASSCGTSTDHSVTLIGMDQASQAWVVVNQWGTDWGVALDGSEPLKDQYSNCASLVAANGCSDWPSCALTCSGAPSPGGYIYLEYGGNTCGIKSEAIAATSTAVGGAPPSTAPSTAPSTTTSYSGYSSASGICVEGTGSGGCNFKSSNCGGTVGFKFKCGSGNVYTITMSDNSDYDLTSDCYEGCTNIQITSR